MGFEYWIGRLFVSGGEKTADVIRMVHSGLLTLWRILRNLGHTVGAAWHHFTGAVEWLMAWLDEVAGRIAVLLRWLYRTVIPAAIRHALALAAHYVQVVAGRIEAWARGAISWLRDRLLGIIADLHNWAHAAVRWLTTRLSDAWTLLSRTARRVWNLLDDPAHLAEWAIGAIVAALLRWAFRNAVPVGRWVMRKGASLALDEAPTIEDWLSRII